MPSRNFSTLCNDTMKGPLPISSKAGEPGIEDIAIFEAAHIVLQQEEEVNMNVLTEELMGESMGIKVASDLLKVSFQALEFKLVSSAFNVNEIAHTVALRQWAERNAGRGGAPQRNREVHENSCGKSSRFRSRRPLPLRRKSSGKGASKKKGKETQRDKPALWSAVERGDEEAVHLGRCLKTTLWRSPLAARRCRASSQSHHLYMVLRY